MLDNKHRCKELSDIIVPIVQEALTVYNQAPVDDIIIEQFRVAVAAHSHTDDIVVYVSPTVVTFRGERMDCRAPDRIEPYHTVHLTDAFRPLIGAKLSEHGMDGLIVGEVSLNTFYYYPDDCG